MAEKHRILLLNDEDEVRAFLKCLLESAGYAVTVAKTSAEMFVSLAAKSHALVLLDLRLTNENGLDVARDLRRRSAIPILMMSGQCEEMDRLLCLELATDDFLCTPFSGRELLARIRANLHPAAEPDYPKGWGNGLASGRYCFGDWVLDLQKRALRRADGSPCVLTQGEFALLSAMVRYPGRIWSRDQLLEHTRGIDSEAHDRTIDVLILRLRRKLEANPRQPAYIRTERGAGYVFAATVTRQ